MQACVFVDVVLSLTLSSDLLFVAGIPTRNIIRVTYTQNNVCAVKGSTVSLHCDVKPPAQEVIWVLGSRAADLQADQRFLNRVRLYNDFETRIMKISDVRESDSAEYRCRVATQPTRVNLTGSPGVSLSVTGDAAVKLCHYDYVNCKGKLPVVCFRILFFFL